MVDPGRLRAVLDRIGDEVAGLARLADRIPEVRADDETKRASPETASSAVVCEKAGERLRQVSETFRGHLPDDRVIDGGVAVNKHVAECHDPPKIDDLCGDSRGRL